MANPLYGSNNQDGALDHWVKTLNAEKKADSPDQLQFQVFETTVAAAGTTDVTFALTVDVVEVWGGYCEISGANADYDFDIGYTGATDAFIADVSGGQGRNGIFACDSDYMANAEDVILTINANSCTTPVKVKIALLTVKPISS